MESSEPIQLGSAAPVRGWESAVRAYQRGQPARARRARRALALVLASAPVDDEVHYLAGLIEAQAECWDEAAGFLAEAAARAPERIGRWRWRWRRRGAHWGSRARRRARCTRRWRETRAMRRRSAIWARAIMRSVTTARPSTAMSGRWRSRRIFSMPGAVGRGC